MYTTTLLPTPPVNRPIPSPRVLWSACLWVGIAISLIPRWATAIAASRTIRPAGGTVSPLSRRVLRKPQAIGRRTAKYYVQTSELEAVAQAFWEANQNSPEIQATTENLGGEEEFVHWLVRLPDQQIEDGGYFDAPDYP